MSADTHIVEAIVEDERWGAALGDADAFATQFVRAAAKEGAVAVLFGDDATLWTLNRAYRGKDAPTNVLSFSPAQANAAALGDIALAYETIAREASEQGKSVAAHAGHMLVHGTLHLLGYDHQTDDDAAIMEALEMRILADLGVADPYQTESAAWEAARNL